MSFRNALLASKELTNQGGFVARMLADDRGIDPVKLCNLLAKISARLDALEQIPSIEA